MTEEELVVMYRNDAGKIAHFRVALTTTSGVLWVAAAASGDSADWSLSGAGAGPDVFALARQYAAETEHDTAAKRGEAAGFRVLHGAARQHAVKAPPFSIVR